MREAKSAEQIVAYLLDSAYQIDECLISHLAPNAKGYIPVQVGGRAGAKWRAHRLVYFIKCEPVADDILICHTCDNRACINPNHLFAGTAKDNTNDMIAKGRKIDDPTVGERRRIATAKLIRPLYNQGLTNREIADKLFLSYATVRAYTFAFSSGDAYPIRV